MPLNTVLAGAAMIELLAFSTGIRAVVPFLRYDALTAQMVRQNVEQDEDCPVCVPAYAMGDRQRIMQYVFSEGRPSCTRAVPAGRVSTGRSCRVVVRFSIA
jgi:hypothetical protein